MDALWKLTPLMEIRSERGFPQGLESTKRFPQFPQGPRRRLHQTLKQQVCQFETVSTEGCTPSASASSVPKTCQNAA